MPKRLRRRQNATSSDDALRVLLGWKTSHTFLSAELSLVGETPESLHTVRVVEVTKDELTIIHLEWRLRIFDLSGATIVSDENVPQRFKNLSTKAVKISLADGGIVVLAVPSYM
jgi:hypothetical protein